MIRKKWLDNYCQLYPKTLPFDNPLFFYQHFITVLLVYLEIRRKFFLEIKSVLVGVKFIAE
jgi:hypothetical protein